MDKKYVCRKILISLYLVLKKDGVESISLKNEVLKEYVPRIENILLEHDLIDSDLFVITPVDETYDEYKNFLIEEFYGNKLGYFNEDYNEIVLICTDYYIDKFIKEVDEYKEVIEELYKVLTIDENKLDEDTKKLILNI